MYSFKKILFIFLLFPLIADGQTKYPPDSREQIPLVLNNTYFGAGFGYATSPYGNNNLINGFQASYFKNAAPGFNVFLGHYFNRYFAAELSLQSLMREPNNYAITINNSNNYFHANVLALSLRPTWPMTKRMSVYALAGLGMLVRTSVTINTLNATSPQNMAVFVTGGGLTYGITSNWFMDLGLQYTLPRTDLCFRRISLFVQTIKITCLLHISLFIS